jgi:hypothetical protein
VPGERGSWAVTARLRHVGGGRAVCRRIRLRKRREAGAKVQTFLFIRLWDVF